MSKRPLKWILLLLALVFVLAACGGNETPEPEPNPNEPTDPADPTDPTDPTDPGPTDPAEPVAPTDLVVTDGEEGGAVLTWQYAGEDGTFTIYRKVAEETEDPEEDPTEDPEEPTEDPGVNITPQQVEGFEQIAADITELTYTDVDGSADGFEYAVTATTADGTESAPVSTDDSLPTDPGTTPPAEEADLFVTNTDDDGAGSLRTVVSEAPDGSVIEIAADIAGQTITLSGSIQLDKNITIQDAADATTATTLSGGGATNPFYIPGEGEPAAPGQPVSITLRGLTISGGAATFGGAIYNGQNLTLIDTTVSDSTATSGGGIYTVAGSSLTLQGNTSITRNSAVAEGGEGGVGGGINVASGSLTIEAPATVTANTAAALGGVFLNTGATFTGEATSVTGNTLTDGETESNIGGPGFTPDTGDGGDDTDDGGDDTDDGADETP